MSYLVHQILARGWELFYILEGKPRADLGMEYTCLKFQKCCRVLGKAKFYPNNICDIFATMHVTSSPVISKVRSILVRQNHQKRIEERPLKKAGVQSMYNHV